jgi:hypothetical protein
MSERVWSTGGMLLVGTKPNYSEKLPVPRCLPQISHGRLWDRTRIFAERGWVLIARAMARPAAVFFPFKIAFYWSINLRIVYLWTGWGRYPYYSAGSLANDGAYTTCSLSFPRFSDRRNAGHSLRYLSPGQELYRCIGRQWYLGYFATARNWAHWSLSFTELGSVRQDTCKWCRGRKVKISWLFRFSDCG